MSKQFPLIINRKMYLIIKPGISIVIVYASVCYVCAYNKLIILLYEPMQFTLYTIKIYVNYLYNYTMLQKMSDADFE